MSRAAGTLALPAAGAAARLEDYLVLAKPRVVALITLTTMAGFYLGARGPLDGLLLVLTALGTALVAGGTLALNQLIERDLDARMARTRRRPLPAGRMSATEALLFGVGLVTAGLAVLTLLVQPVAAMVTAATVITYLFAYTPLKRRSALCTVVGALPGALPPMAGWAAATGELGAGAWALFGILFFWQLPHSLAIARLYRDDYQAAGIQVLPVVDRDGASTGRQVVLHSLALLGAGIAPALVGVAGGGYLVASLIGGLALLVLAVAFFRREGAVTARRLYLGSLAYMPLILLALVLDKAAA